MAALSYWHIIVVFWCFFISFSHRLKWSKCDQCNKRHRVSWYVKDAVALSPLEEKCNQEHLGNSLQKSCKNLCSLAGKMRKTCAINKWEFQISKGSPPSLHSPSLIYYNFSKLMCVCAVSSCHASWFQSLAAKHLEVFLPVCHLQFCKGYQMNGP